MLIRYSIENVLSFSKKGVLNLISGKKYRKHEDHVLRTYAGYELLKTSAIYGANAAGKSNMLDALRQLRELVVKGTYDRYEPIPIQPFKFSGYDTQPSIFDIEYISNGKVYKYHIEILRSVIISEILYRLEGSKKIFNELFIRKSNAEITTDLELMNLDESDEKVKLRAEIYKEDLRPNQPFLFEAVNRQLKYVEDAYTWFRDKLLIIGCFTSPKKLNQFVVQDGLVEEINRLLVLADTGITRIKVIERPIEDYLGKIDQERRADLLRTVRQNGFARVRTEKYKIEIVLKDDKLVATELKTIHSAEDGSDVEFDLSEESDGTQRFLDIIPALFMLTIGEATVFIDEIERSLHPVLVLKMLDFFFQNSKGKPGQLIFTTHESTLMSLRYFRQDEIWFVEKSKAGTSVTYSLSDFKPRFDKDIQKSYFEGQFGAVPFLTNPGLLEEF